jgi:penicillin-binding protein 2
VASDRISKWETGWLWVLVVLMLAALGGLVAAMGHFQLSKSDKYRSDFRQQSIRRVRVPASRGLITDRNGVVFAENRPSYCIVIYVEELRQPGTWSNTMDKVEEVIDSVSGIIQRDRVVKRKDIWNHINMRLPLPFTAWRDLDPVAIARFEESEVRLPGVDVQAVPLRTYPLGSSAGHVLGYVARKSPPKGRRGPYKNYYLPEIAGTSGVERVFNEDLAGEAGGYLITVDATGYRYKEEHERPAVPGKSIKLAIDHRIQKLVEDALVGERGAGVMLDPRNGDILAMASSPVLNPNLFVGGISQRAWDRIRLDKKGKPLLNRSISEIYPPGSTFKPVVAIAALEGGRAEADTTFVCRGFFSLGRIEFSCFRRTVHGPLQVREAIARSCNPYFCQLGLRCGYDRIYHMAGALGLGSRTGFDLGYDERGILPRRRSDGDTCNVSMGQGALAVTPLQMAGVVATIANQGTVYRPRLILRDKVRGQIVNRMGWAAETMRIVRGGMHDVVHSPRGTGKRALVPGVEMAGKTGTAQYGPRGSNKTHVWMLCFAPFERPRYALAIVIEDGQSGGQTVAPRIGQIMQGVFRMDGTLM